MSSQAIVYSKDLCPYCDEAIALLNSKGVNISVIKVEKDIDKPTFKEQIFNVSGTYPETVPQIILDTQYIGGCDNLIDFYERLDDADSIDFSDIEI